MSLDAFQAVVGKRLRETAAASVRDQGIPEPQLGGKLLRPAISVAAALPSGAPIALVDALPQRFWEGVLAIQMVHEASLLHDDILDAATLRRGRPTLQAARGVGPALVAGDHLLTSAYRLIAATDSLPLVRSFSRAVERTVAGEAAQGRSAGRWLSEAEYREIITHKSGELFGCALALSRLLEGREGTGELHMGVRIGCFYQMVDDFLDLCPSAHSGKPPLQDLLQGKWTWPLAETGICEMEELPDGREGVEGLRRLLFGLDDRGGSAMRRAARRIQGEMEGLLMDWEELRAGEERIPEFLGAWALAVRQALREEERSIPSIRQRVGRGAPREGREGAGSGDGSERPEESAGLLLEEDVRRAAAGLGDPEAQRRYFAWHARSFHFASRLFPPEEARLVSGIYAFCRFTDDLVDQAPHLSVAEREARLDVWLELVRAAYSGEDTGIPLLSLVLGETSERGVPVLYAEELIRGVGMDLRPREYPTLESLRRYSYRVAAVVGLWLTELFGTRTPWVLRRAESLGHAMQLTNILRDVGEDWERGRLYLPLDLLRREGIDRGELARAFEEGSLPQRWDVVMEELLAAAERDYRTAFEAIPELPPFFQRPVAVAARVYQGIHQEIRRNGYDNLNRRAYTSLPRKAVLGFGGLVELRRLRRGSDAGGRVPISAPAP